MIGNSASGLVVFSAVSGPDSTSFLASPMIEPSEELGSAVDDVDTDSVDDSVLVVLLFVVVVATSSVVRADCSVVVGAAVVVEVLPSVVATSSRLVVSVLSVPVSSVVSLV